MAPLTPVCAAATTIWTVAQAIDWLKTLWAPILPHSSEQIHQKLHGGGEGGPGVGPFFGRQYTETVTDARGSHLVLRYDHSGATGQWAPIPLAPGVPLPEPKALFTKLEPDTAAQEAARLGQE